ncbi:MAG: hypothetical protein EOM31_08605 [Bacteroidia bacterium]|nr:hypothetical protein [Bacteroidia bacterium]
MYKKLVVATLLVVLTGSLWGQQKEFSYKLYGQIRTDFFYNSRQNEEMVDGLFQLFPKDEQYDHTGQDLNGTANSNFYLLYSRLGADIKAPRLFNADASAKVEVDFRGSGSGFSTLRLRHAYFNLDWGKSAILVGQTWHPLFGEVYPRVQNLSTGAPFQPFSRAPQIRYRYTSSHLRLTAAAVWQSQFLSQGANGRSQEYLKNGCLPELFAGIDYIRGHFQAGVGVEFLSIKPRLNAQSNNKLYQVNERVNALSYEAHAQYTPGKWFIAGKSVLGSNLTQTCMLGGFAVKAVEGNGVEQSYTPITFSSSWINVVYGKQWRPGLFIGYAKNLGTATDTEVSTFQAYGTGLHIDQLTTVGGELSYVLPHWSFGLEYTLSSAAYGTPHVHTGEVENTHTICNHRIVATTCFSF